MEFETSRLAFTHDPSLAPLPSIPETTIEAQISEAQALKQEQEDTEALRVGLFIDILRHEFKTHMGFDTEKWELLYKYWLNNICNGALYSSRIQNSVIDIHSILARGYLTAETQARLYNGKPWFEYRTENERTLVLDWLRDLHPGDVEYTLWIYFEGGYRYIRFEAEKRRKKQRPKTAPVKKPKETLNDLGDEFIDDLFKTFKKFKGYATTDLDTVKNFFISYKNRYDKYVKIDEEDVMHTILLYKERQAKKQQDISEKNILKVINKTEGDKTSKKKKSLPVSFLNSMRIINEMKEVLRRKYYSKPGFSPKDSTSESECNTYLSKTMRYFIIIYKLIKEAYKVKPKLANDPQYIYEFYVGYLEKQPQDKRKEIEFEEGEANARVVINDFFSRDLVIARLQGLYRNMHGIDTRNPSALFNFWDELCEESQIIAGIFYDANELMSYITSHMDNLETEEKKEAERKQKQKAEREKRLKEKFKHVKATPIDQLSKTKGLYKVEQVLEELSKKSSIDEEIMKMIKVEVAQMPEIMMLNQEEDKKSVKIEKDIKEGNEAKQTGDTKRVKSAKRLKSRGMSKPKLKTEEPAPIIYKHKSIKRMIKEAWEKIIAQNPSYEKSQRSKIQELFPEPSTKSKSQIQKEESVKKWVASMGENLKSLDPFIYKSGVFKQAKAMYLNGQPYEALEKLKETFNMPYILNYYEPIPGKVRPGINEKPHENFSSSKSAELLSNVYQLYRSVRDIKKDIKRKIEILNREDKSSRMNKTFMCPLNERCPNDIRPRWPKTEVSNSSTFGEKCEYSHHVFELRFQQEQQAKKRAKEAAISKLKRALEEFPKKAPWRPDGKVYDCNRCFTTFTYKSTKKRSDKEPSAFHRTMQCYCNKCALEKRMQEKEAYFLKKADDKREKTVISNDSKQKMEKLSKKLGLYRKARTLLKARRFVAAFNTITKALEMVREEVAEEEKEIDYKTIQLRKKIGVDDEVSHNRSEYMLSVGSSIDHSALPSNKEELLRTQTSHLYKPNANHFLNYQIECTYLEIEGILMKENNYINSMREKASILEDEHESLDPPERKSFLFKPNKTKMCPKILAKEKCPDGIKCKFAHHPIQLDLVDKLKVANNLNITSTIIENKLRDDALPKDWTYWRTSGNSLSKFKEPTLPTGITEGKELHHLPFDS